MLWRHTVRRVCCAMMECDVIVRLLVGGADIGHGRALAECRDDGLWVGRVVWVVEGWCGLGLCWGGVV